MAGAGDRHKSLRFVGGRELAITNEALAKLVCYTLCVVRQSHVELGIETVSWQEMPSGPADVLPLVRPC